MLKIIRRIGITATLVVLSLMILLTLFLFYTEVGMAKEIGIHEPGLSEYNTADVPGSIFEDAIRYAKEIIGQGQEKIKEFADQLVTMYMQARESDIVIIFNSGGWGWNLTRETPGWSSILEGIQGELEKLGYNSIMLNYRRTSSGVRGCVREFVEAARQYPNKAEDLATRLEFLAEHLPETRIIVAGESTGTVITDKTMRLLEDNQQIILRYCDAEGNITSEINPNGAMSNIAGIVNEKRNVFGLMPHPERSSERILGSASDDGLIIFQSLKQWLK